FYDINGNISKRLQKVDGNRTKETRYEYNPKGKPVRIVELVDANTFSYNSLENKEKVEIYSIYQYDLNDNLISYEDANQNVITYEYDALNRKIRESKQVTKENKKDVIIQIDTTYDWNGNIRTETRPYEKGAKPNATTSYEYDKAGNRVKTIDALGNITAYEYDRVGRPIREVQPKNYQADKSVKEMEHTEYIYDACNRLKAKVLHYNNFLRGKDGTWATQPVRVVSEAYQYDALGNVKKKLNAGGILSVTGELEEQIAAGYGTESSYYLNGSLASYLDSESKDAGYQYTVRYQYNGLGQMVHQMFADGTKQSYDYDGVGNVLTTYVNGTRKSSAVYNKLSQLTQSTDANGNKTTFEWNLLGKQSRVNFPSDQSIKEHSIIYQYDKLGNLTKTVDFITGLITVMAYNQRGLMLSETRQNIDASKKISVQKEYDIYGNVASETDANGTMTTYTYDVLNQLIAMKNIGQINKLTSYTYDANGNKISETDWLGNKTTFRYDGMNRLIESKDSLGNVMSQLEYNADHAQSASYDSYGNCTSYEYDKNLRLVKTVDPYLYEVTNGYDVRGNLITKTDQNKNVTNYRYNSEQALTQVVNALNEQTSYTYDANGNMLTMTDGRGFTTTYRYNARNLLIEKIDSGKEKNSEIYTYYADGNIATKTDRNEKETNYRYDCFGRLVYESIGSQYKEYTYDKMGNVLIAEDNTGDITRTYDSQGRVTKKTVTSLETTNEITTYRYDITTGVPSGMAAEESIDPKGNATLKIYDQVGRLYQVYPNMTAEHLGSATGSDAVTYQYYPNGSRKSVTYPNGAIEQYTYTKKNQILQLKNMSSDGTILQCYTYTYDPVGNQISKEESGQESYPGLTQYTYDSLNRLSKVKEISGKLLSYEYDKSGNRTMELSQMGMDFIRTSYDYDERNRLISSLALSHTDDTRKSEYSMTEYSYDKNGNMLQKKTACAESITEDNLNDLTKLPKFGIKKISEFNSDPKNDFPVDSSAGTDYLTRYAYDNFNRLTCSTSKGASIFYQYNAENYRIQKSVNGEVIRYLYEADKVVLELNENGEEIGRNVYGTNLIYRVAKSETNKDAYYYLYNAHGDVTGLLNQAGTVAATYCYDAFGNLLSKQGQANNTITYAGYQYDAETELYYLNARYYDSSIARFISEDSYTGKRNDPLTLNLYTYCSNEPIMYTDPTGHWTVAVHGNDTYNIAYKAFTDYIKDKSDEIYVYKKDKNGKDTKKVDDTATKAAREKWVTKQEKEAKKYATAISAGDKYVDVEKNILHKAGNSKMFHGFSQQGKADENKFVISTKKITSDIMNDKSFSKTAKNDKLQTYIINPANTLAKNKGDTLSNESIPTKYFDTTSKNAKGSKEEAAMFVLGMGLHTTQDTVAHAKVTNGDPIKGNHITNTDEYGYYYNESKKRMVELKAGEVDERKEETEDLTKNYINDILDAYGKKLFSLPKKK
ncbi:RHS repeat-associated core domain-containing protein, partial [Lachnoclostridium sp.]